MIIVREMALNESGTKFILTYLLRSIELHKK